MNLTHFPRRFFAHLPTPLEPLKNLSSLLGGPNIWIKRDDCTGVAGGGNKTRKLEFLIGDALAKNCDTIITQGATQSNHVRQTAAVACMYGFKIVALLEDRTGSKDENHNHNGNVLLTNIFGAEITRRAGGTDMAAEMVIVSEQLKAEGKKPYIIPGGGSNFVGALGYANCAFELMQQLNSQNIKIDHLVHATGSTGTQAGLIAGMEAINAHIPILGISVRQPKEAQEESVFKLARETAEKLDVQHALKKEKVVANSDYVGQGYGFPADSTLEAIKLLALHEGILLDPVYSGKGMAGLIGLIRLGHFKKGENVVFLHTGGAQALHGYLHDFH